MTSTNNSSFWTRPAADRIAAREAIMAVSGDWGDASGAGFSIHLRQGTADQVLAVAARHGLGEVSREYGLVENCRTVLRIDLA